MMLARKTWRPLAVALLLMVMTLVMGAMAMAEDDPVSFTIQISPDALTSPGDVSVSLRVSNSSDQDMVDPVTLYDPAGSVVPSFGDGGSYILKSGDSLPWEGTWNVTQAQLDAGEIAYTIKYHIQDESGAMVEFRRQATARIQYDGEHAALTVTRAITPEVVRSGGTATVTYELYNSGNVELKDIRVKEHISKNAQTVKSLPAGERASVKFTSKIGNADLVSSADITYKAEGSTKTLSQKVDDATIPLAKPNLKIELSSDSTGVNIGEAAQLKITFTNNGNVSYSNVSVSEAKKGEILTNLSIPAGATITETKEFTLTEPTTFKVTATLPDNTGETRTLSSNELKLGVFDPEKVLLLTLNLTVEPEAVEKTPADVRFHLTVTNNSNIKAENIAITHGTKPISTIASLEPGASITLDRDVTISQTGNYRFTASLKDSLGNTATFESETLYIGYARPVVTPTPAPRMEVTPQPSVTPAPADPILTQGKNILWIAGCVLGGLFLVSLALFVVSTVMRARNRSKSNAAYDHLELAERRDYTEPAEEGDAPLPEDIPDDSGIADIPAANGNPLGEMPHEKLIKAAGPAGERIADASDRPSADGEGGYRISRSDMQQTVDEMFAQRAAAKTRQLDAAFTESRKDAQANAPQTEVPPMPGQQNAPDQGKGEAPRRRGRHRRAGDGE